MSKTHTMGIAKNEKDTSARFPAKSIGILTIWINRRKEKISENNNISDYQISNLLEALDKLNLK